MPSSINLDQKFRQQWLDKLWAVLFDDDHKGLLSPRQVRASKQDRALIRRLEMKAIFEAEEDINRLHLGLKSFDFQGNLVDTPPIDDVATFDIIERDTVSVSDTIGTTTSPMLLKSVAKEIEVFNLQRALNLRKMALLAEEEIYLSPLCAVSPQWPTAEWLTLWKQVAQDIYNAEIQRLMVRVLIAEVAKPGNYAMTTIQTLKILSVNDVEMVHILAKFSFGQFIFNAETGYFNSDVYRNLFEITDDLGLISGVGLEPRVQLFASTSPGSYERVFHCADKAIKVIHCDNRKQLQLPVYRVTRPAREIMALDTVQADLAYLFEVAAFIKNQGFEVSLGECKGSVDAGFVEKVAL